MQRKAAPKNFSFMNGINNGMRTPIIHALARNSKEATQRSECASQ